MAIIEETEDTLSLGLVVVIIVLIIWLAPQIAKLFSSLKDAISAGASAASDAATGAVNNATNQQGSSNPLEVALGNAPFTTQTVGGAALDATTAGSGGGFGIADLGEAAGRSVAGLFNNSSDSGEVIPGSGGF